MSQLRGEIPTGRLLDIGCGIGGFLGWQAVIFSLMLSAVMGAMVGITLIALRKSEWSSRVPYGPYIALAATIWIFGGERMVRWWLGQ